MRTKMKSDVQGARARGCLARLRLNFAAVRMTIVGSAAIIAGAGSLRALEITLPQETARLVESPLPGYGLAQALCMTCHSADYIKMQPVSSRAFWQGSVTKMQKVFGAQIPASAVEPIVDYLVKTYGNERGAAGAAQKATDTRSAPPPGQTATK